MKRTITPVLVALLITACVGTSILGIGGAAFFNKNGVTASDVSSSAGGDSLNPAVQTSQIDQMQNLISQYQDHEQQYQQREQQLQAQLDQANAQLQQYQNLIQALQQRGVIRITGDGRVFIDQ